jgi:hypothetical protein
MMPSREYMISWRAAHPGCRKAEYQRRRARDLQKHKDVARRAWKKYEAKNKEKIRLRQKLAARKRRLEKPEIQKQIKKRAAEKRLKRLEELAGRSRPELCEMCGNPGLGDGSYGRLGIVFDHCHTSGKFRGWLCDRCNKVLGLVKDDPDLLMTMAHYLEEHHGGSDGGETREDAEISICRPQPFIPGL